MADVKEVLKFVLLKETEGAARRQVLRAVHHRFDKLVEEVERSPKTIKKQPVALAVEIVSVLSDEHKTRVLEVDSRVAVQEAAAHAVVEDENDVIDADNVIRAFLSHRLSADDAYVWAETQDSATRDRVVKEIALRAAKYYNFHGSPTLSRLAYNILYDLEPAVTMDMLLAEEPSYFPMFFKAASAHITSIDSVVLSYLLSLSPNSVVQRGALLRDVSLPDDSLAHLEQVNTAPSWIIRAMFHHISDDIAEKLAAVLDATSLVSLLGVVSDVNTLRQLVVFSPEPTLDDRRSYDTLRHWRLLGTLDFSQRNKLVSRFSSEILLSLLSHNHEYVASNREMFIDITRTCFDRQQHNSLIQLDVSDRTLSNLEETNRVVKLETTAGLVYKVFPVDILFRFLTDEQYTVFAKHVVEHVMSELPEASDLQLFIDLADSWDGTLAQLLDAVEMIEELQPSNQAL